MTPLTHKQKELLEFLRACDEAPSFEEMQVALDLKSKSGVHRLVSALEERGYIKRIPNRARCIELCEAPRLPDANTLSGLPTKVLSAEARRRGLVLGEYHRFTAHIGKRAVEKRRFVEVA